MQIFQCKHTQIDPQCWGEKTVSVEYFSVEVSMQGSYKSNSLEESNMQSWVSSKEVLCISTVPDAVFFSIVKKRDNKKNYNMNNHIITGGFKSIRKQVYKLYIE